MVITRKLLAPALTLLAIALLVFIGVDMLDAYRSYNADTSQTLERLHVNFEAEISRMADLSMALAKQTAASPEVQTAFIFGDRQRLFGLTAGAFERLETEIDLAEFQFTTTPAQVLLDVSAPETAGRDLSSLRPILKTANREGRSISGLELTASGFSIVAASPIRGRPADGDMVEGSVSYGIAVDSSLLENLRQRYGGEWQLLVHTADQNLGPGGTHVQVPGPRPNLFVLASTFAQPIFASELSYDRALSGLAATAQVRSGRSTITFLTIPLRDYFGTVIGVIDIAWDSTAAWDRLLQRFTIAASAGFAMTLVVSLILFFHFRRLLQPIQTLTVSAQAVAAGKLRHPLPRLRPEHRRNHEIDDLNRSFHTIVAQLRQYAGDVESQVANRTRLLQERSDRLQAAAEIGREVAGLSDPDRVLGQAVDLIRSRFDYDYAAVYLIDQKGETAVLQAAAGEKGQQLLSAGHRIELRTSTAANQGMIGMACGTGKPQIAADITQNRDYVQNPLLPETASEAVLPLRSGNQIIGALDIQCRTANAFGDEDMTILQVIADQLAAVISNARLIAALNRTVADLETAQGKATREDWMQIVEDAQRIGYRVSSSEPQLGPEGGLKPITRRSASDSPFPAIMDGWLSADPEGVISVPIRLRDQTIGAIQVRFDSEEADQNLPALIEEVSSRLGVMLESARLLEEAQRLAERERRINLIGTEMRSSVNLESILQNTVRELGKSIGVRRAFIQLGEFDSEVPNREAPSAWNGSGESEKASGSE